MPKTMQNYYNTVVYYSNVTLITVLFWQGPTGFTFFLIVQKQSRVMKQSKKFYLCLIIVGVHIINLKIKIISTYLFPTLFSTTPAFSPKFMDPRLQCTNISVLVKAYLLITLYNYICYHRNAYSIHHLRIYEYQNQIQNTYFSFIARFIQVS